LFPSFTTVFSGADKKRFHFILAGLHSFVLLQQGAIHLLQRLGWCCIECAIHHERYVREE